MIVIYPVQPKGELPWCHPLHVGRFFNLERQRWAARRRRQALILAVAQAWRQLAARCPAAPGLVKEEIFLSHLAKQAPDAKEILKVFFTVERVGYRLSDGQAAPTVISPRKLPADLAAAVQRLDAAQLEFDPGPAPRDEGLTRTLVAARQERASLILAALETSGRQDLIPPVKWLLSRAQPITFYHRPSGRLQARDTSTWPVRAIETWPGWLRAELFGTCVDIDNAFTQFLLVHLAQKHGNQGARLRLKYPDLVAIAEDKLAFRAALIREVLKTDVSPESTKLIKRLLMALANGSNASPRLLVASTTRCEAANIIRAGAPWLSTADLLEAGARLHRLARQFRNARRELCLYLLNAPPTPQNQRRIFAAYFSWEREARYKLWRAVGHTGLHLHDGIDGALTVEAPAQLVERILREHGLKVTVKGT